MKKEYAGFWVRAFAGLLDMIFLIPPFLLLIYVFGVSEFRAVSIEDNFQSYSTISASGSGHYIDLISYILSIAYLFFFIASKRQATLGKVILGIYVGNPNGSRLSPAKSFARALASMLTAATLGLGFLPVIFTKEKTALHDLICNTRVFHGRKRPRSQKPAKSQDSKQKISQNSK